LKIFEEFKIQFEKPDWSHDPELCLVDTLLENSQELFKLLARDITAGVKATVFGRGDVPSVEQIARAALYKEMKKLDYRQLGYHQIDSRICAYFLKIDPLRPYSFQMWQKYISKISSDSLNEFMVGINKIAIDQGLETVERLRIDSTVVESNIHYPTNNSLVWDCIKESHRLLKYLSEEISEVNYRNYQKAAKRTYYKINVTKGKKREELFVKQLVTFTKCINQVSNVVKKKPGCSVNSLALLFQLEELLPLMEQIHDITYRKEVNKEVVPNDEKLFSIYERHTDIIVKGGREALFGHKTNLASGSFLILACNVEKGNPPDSKRYIGIIDQVKENYETTPRDTVADGGYASIANMEHARERGIQNIVFNKVVGSLKNHVSSLNMETRLKKWRSGIEAVISNLKRGFNLKRCNWKGWEHFQAKVLWSVIAYNIRVITARLIQQV